MRISYEKMKSEIKRVLIKKEVYTYEQNNGIQVFQQYLSL